MIFIPVSLLHKCRPLSVGRCWVCSQDIKFSPWFVQKCRETCFERAVNLKQSRVSPFLASCHLRSVLHVWCMPLLLSYVSIYMYVSCMCLCLLPCSARRLVTVNVIASPSPQYPSFSFHPNFISFIMTILLLLLFLLFLFSISFSVSCHVLIFSSFLHLFNISLFSSDLFHISFSAIMSQSHLWHTMSVPPFLN